MFVSNQEEENSHRKIISKRIEKKSLIEEEYSYREMISKLVEEEKSFRETGKDEEEKFNREMVSQKSEEKSHPELVANQIEKMLIKW